MDNNSEVVFDKCVTCQLWGPVKEGPDGKSYCSIHIRIKREEPVNKKHVKAANKWLNWFRTAINCEPTSPE